MMPPMEKTLHRMAAEFDGERAISCPHTRSLHWWWRLKNLFDDGAREPVKFTGDDGSVQEVEQSDGPHPMMGGLISGERREIHWQAACRECHDEVGGDPTKLKPRRYFQLNGRGGTDDNPFKPLMATS